MLNTVEINDIDELQMFRDVWNRLLADTPRASFFHSLDWLTTYWRHFGQDQCLRVIVVLDVDEPVGFVPLVVRNEDKRIATLRVLTYPLHDWGSFYGPVGSDPTGALNAALRHVAQTTRQWDTIDLRWITPGDVAERVTDQAMDAAGFRGRRRLWKQTAVIDTNGSWDAYIASRTQKHRASIRRYERKLNELGEITFERYRPRGSAMADDDPRWEEYEQCVALAARSWQGSSTDGTTLSHLSVSSFLRDAHLAAVSGGYLDLNLLRLDGCLIGFAYNYHYDGAVHGLRVGYDAKYSKAGAGKVLWANTFRDSFERGDRIYDIGPDSLEVKRHWLTRIIPVYAYAHYPAFAAKTQFVRMARAVRDWHQDVDRIRSIESEE
jgi:CelD/BcsL family acetyltransferase involved in cellulose biosynthesis